MASQYLQLSQCRVTGIHLDQKCRYPQNRSADLDNEWYARHEISSVLDFDTICRVLECSCPNCQSTLDMQGDQDFSISYRSGDQRKVKQYAIDIRGSEHKKGSLMTFALLIHIGSPTLIIPLLRASRDDGTLESWSQDTTAEEGYHEDLRRRLYSIWWTRTDQENQTLLHIAGKFVQEMYKFTAPMFDWKGLRKFPRQMRMPFCIERSINAPGVSATVFEIEVHPYYLNVSQETSGSRDNVFVRKQLNSDLPLTAFLLEDRNVDKVSALADPHIVPLYNSYQKGTECNIVFPKALGDLEAFLTRPEKDFRSINRIPFHEQPMWKELLGLAKALDRVINFDDTLVGSVPSQDDLRKQVLGYHFDIKPANILVFDNPNGKDRFTLKITDFGQARFRESAATSSRMHNTGGTLTYAPPEGNLDGHLTLNTKYDVWSLGCVFTELMVFLRKGPDGLETFRQERINRDMHGEDSCFFDTIVGTDGQKSILRPAVDRWITESLQPQSGDSDKACKFFERFENILRRMLNPQAAERIDSREVYSELDTLLAVSVDQQLTQSSLSLPNDEHERDVNGQKLSTLEKIFSRVSWDSDANFSPCKVYDVGSDRTLSLLTIILPSGQSQLLHIDKTNGILFPWFAYRSNRSHSTQSDSDIQVTSSDMDAKHAQISYKSHDLDELRVMQGFLTGHTVLASYDLADIQIEEKTTKWEHLHTVKKHIQYMVTDRRQNRHPPVNAASISESNATGLPTVRPISTGSKCTVQLWREAVTRKPLRTFTIPPVPTYRLVIFKGKCMSIIPFTYGNRTDASLWLKTKQESKPPSPQVHFYPTDKSREYYLQGFRINPDAEHKHQYAGIPMDLDDLHEQESISRVAFSRVVMQFKDANEAQEFREHYRSADVSWKKMHSQKLE